MYFFTNFLKDFVQINQMKQNGLNFSEKNTILVIEL